MNTNGKNGRKYKVAITDADYESHEPEREVLSNLNVELVKFQCNTEDEVIKNCWDADALLNQYAPITRRVIEHLKNTRVIVRYGIGVDNIDLRAATERGIFVANVIYETCDVADHTVALILSLARKIPWVNQKVKEGRWDWREVQPVERIKGKTVGIIGFGRIGREVAARIKAFKTKIIAYDPYVPAETFEKKHVKKVDLETLLSTSDIIVIHVPLSKETHHLINEKRLGRIKKTTLLVNTSRGPIVDEVALYKALKEGWLTAAALDVLEKEPPEKDNPLLRLNNVLITPHMAWYSTSSLTEIQTIAAEEVARVLSGQTPKNLVNKDVLNRLNRSERIEHREK
jgi:D-3-phosphoglycerate dehydrogenase